MNAEHKEEFIEEDFDEDEVEGEDLEYEDLTTEEAIQELKEELTVQSELLEKIVEVSEKRLEQESILNENLTRILEKLSNSLS
ncbi:MAG: hypothetical protein QNJ31_04135 [Candidatus Caenarcaniphilales bacterium]|nr:hypothetical protein [Candidatus Caenarcaniphilales bacterium]